MQTVYIADLPLAEDALPATASAVDEWLTERIGVEHDRNGQYRSPTPDLEVRRGQLQGTAGSVTRWLVRDRRQQSTGWSHEVVLWLCQQAQGESFLRCRLGLVSATGQLSEPGSEIGRPRIVGTLLERQQVIVDGHRLGHRRVVGSSDVPDLVGLLDDPARRLPVVVITPSASTGRPAIDGRQLARRLGGLAHVVELSARTATFALTEALGDRQWSVYNGACRLYWPGMRGPGDDPGRHTLWFQDRVHHIGMDLFASRLFARLGRLSATVLGAPPLEAQLQTEINLLKGEQQVAAIKELRDRAAAGVASDPAWVEDFERTLVELEEVTNERNDLAVDVDRLTQENQQLRRDIGLIATASTSAETTPSEDRVPAGAPASVLDAVRIAEATCRNLVILPEALESARASQYDDPQQVLDDLRALEDLANSWQGGRLTQGFKAAMAEHGITGYRDGVSTTALNKYGSDYARDYNGQRITLGPHLRRGTGAPNVILRIYWYNDEAARALVVGHVGPKLRDDSNP